MSENERAGRMRAPVGVVFSEPCEHWQCGAWMCTTCYNVIKSLKPKCPLRRRKSTDEEICMAAILKTIAKRKIDRRTVEQAAEKN